MEHEEKLKMKKMETGLKNRTKVLYIKCPSLHQPSLNLGKPFHDEEKVNGNLPMIHTNIVNI